MKQRIAVIGGGVGAITAVWGLTQVPDWQQRYEITVYQLGWRLGGKGASGRNMALGARIEEHGLHVWAGFYQNAFHHMRACYGELGTLGLRAPDAPLGTFDQAFKPLGHVFLTERIGTEWRPWVVDLPVDGTLPGDATETPGPWEIFRRAMRTIALFLENGSFTNKVTAIDPEVARRLQSVRRAHAALTTHAHAMPDDPRDHLGSHLTILSRLVREAQSVVHAKMTPESLSHDDTRRALYLADLALAYARGTAESDTFTKGYDGLDQWEFTDWLRRNGAREESLSSVILRACYDFVFGFRAGDIHRPDAGAGTAVRAMGRLILDYDGAIFWKMQAGMGDTIFAPTIRCFVRGA